MNKQELLPHLFRTEFSRIAAVLSKQFGLEHLEAAEDIASETFLAAFETWTYKGVPENPTGWLYAVAKNKARNLAIRKEIFREKVTELSLSSDIKTDIDLSEQNITDSQLQMLFTICHPSIPMESQVGLALRILCGFGVDEIANAFLTNKETINKRLFRARERLRIEKMEIQFPGDTVLSNRLDTVLTTLYLLFNEGYCSESNDLIIRKDLCLEAMRLTYLLLGNSLTNKPPVNALLALMCFHTSRFDARLNSHGELILYEDQDESLWNQELISTGVFYLKEASVGNHVSKYHIEASIAYWHTIKIGSKEKWENILTLYDQLLGMEPSPIAALNRAFAFSKVYGSEAALYEVKKLDLSQNHYYHTLLGELYWEMDGVQSKTHFETALSLAQTQPDKQVIQKRIDEFQIH